MKASPSDAELILESQRDPRVFWQLYDRWSEKVLAYFYRRTLDPEDSTDLVAETFAVAYQPRDHFRDIGRPGAAWLFGIARKGLGRHRRRQAGELKAVRRLGVQVPTLDDESIDRIEALIDMETYGTRLRAALRTLGPKEQDALQLRVMEDMDYRGWPALLDVLRVRLGSGSTEG